MKARAKWVLPAPRSPESRIASPARACAAMIAASLSVAAGFGRITSLSIKSPGSGSPIGRCLYLGVNGHGNMRRGTAKALIQRLDLRGFGGQDALRLTGESRDGANP